MPRRPALGKSYTTFCPPEVLYLATNCYPSQSHPPCATVLPHFFTRYPTPAGPMIVQRTIAQIVMRNSSLFRRGSGVEYAICAILRNRTPGCERRIQDLLCVFKAHSSPISPRAIMAKPNNKAPFQLCPARSRIPPMKEPSDPGSFHMRSHTPQIALAAVIKIP